MCYRTGPPAERRITTGTVVDNRDAHQVYLGAVSRHPRNPLEAGEEFVAILQPEECVALIPANVVPSFPIEVPLPDLERAPRCVDGLPIATKIDTNEP